MAQYEKDFSGEVDGVAISDFTARLDATAGRFWALDGNDIHFGVRYGWWDPSSFSDGQRAFSWDDLDADPDRGELDIRLKFWVNSTTGVGVLRFYLRAASNTQSYFLNCESNGIQFRGYLNGGGSTQISSVGGIGLEASTWYWVRIQARGSNLRAKIWKDEDGALAGEPASWDTEGTDSTFTIGWAGPGRWEASHNMAIDYISVGTGVDDAPTSLIVDQGRRLSSINTQVLESSVAVGRRLSSINAQVLVLDPAFVGGGGGYVVVNLNT